MKNRIPTGLGISSLLVIFTVLCLCVIVTLSLSTVQTQQTFSQAGQQSVTAYYAADSQAQEILAMLRAGQIPEGVAVENDVYTYTCPISQNRVLAVSVWVQGTAYEILQWQTVNTGHWKPEEGLPVWQGDR